jgi:predicted glycogen debranching enzyme
MAYLNLNKSQLVNLEYSLYREMLRTNRAGSYSSSTVTGCNTRKYHGMLVCPIKHFDGGHFVLLSSLDISLVQHEQIFNLGIHKFQGNHFEPKGHKYLTEIDMDITPKRVYRVGGMVLSTEILMSETQEQVLLKVTLEEAHSDTQIRFKPFLAFRNVHDLTRQNMMANTRCEALPNGVKIKMYQGFPYLHMQINKENEFVHVPDWYRNIEYIKEQHRGYPYKEDLFVPGYFEMKIKKGESIIFSASTTEAKPAGLKAKFTREHNKRIPRDTLLHNLLNSAQQFIQKHDKSYRLTAGFHWYNERLRDTLVALPGLMTYQEDQEPYLSILDQAVKDIRHTYLAESEVGLRPCIKNIDVPLWLFYTLQEVKIMFPSMDICTRYSNALKEIIEYILRLKNGPISIDDSGLLWAKMEGIPMTWMDAIVNGQPVTQRPGYVVEINALWYNALVFYKNHCKLHQKEALNIATLIEKVKSAFVEKFWNKQGNNLFDYVDGDYKDASIRPNQILAVALPNSPLDIEQRKKIIDVIKKELLTPKGLRTLSPSSPFYEGLVEGPQSQRDKALHQGSVYPWLAAFFAEGYLSIYKENGVTLVKRMLDGFEQEMGNQCLSTISEYFNGNPPHQGKGAVSMAWNVAAVIRIIKIIEKYN